MYHFLGMDLSKADEFTLLPLVGAINLVIYLSLFRKIYIYYVFANIISCASAIFNYMQMWYCILTGSDGVLLQCFQSYLNPSRLQV